MGEAMTMATLDDHECFSEDWRRTNPDLVLYLPKEPSFWIEAVDHVLVDVTPGGDLLAIFALASQPHGADYRVAYARSADGGRTWSPVGIIDGPGAKPGQVSAFGFPVISRRGRIYCFYNHGRAIGDSYQTSFLRCKYSDDDGRTWIDGEVRIPYRSSANDHPDRSIGANCVVWQKPIRDARDRPIIGFTRWTNSYIKVARREDDFTMSRRDSQAEFMRFENIDESPHPRDVQITWLQDDDTAIRVPVPYEPEASRDYSYCEEPSAVLLPDGRLFTVARTATGQIWYTVSSATTAKPGARPNRSGTATTARPCSTRSRPAPSSRWTMAGSCSCCKTTTGMATAAADRATSTPGVRSSLPWANTGRTRISRSGSASPSCSSTRRTSGYFPSL